MPNSIGSPDCLLLICVCLFALYPPPPPVRLSVTTGARWLALCAARLLSPIPAGSQLAVLKRARLRQTRRSDTYTFRRHSHESETTTP